MTERLFTPWFCKSCNVFSTWYICALTCGSGILCDVWRLAWRNFCQLFPTFETIFDFDRNRDFYSLNYFLRYPVKKTFLQPISLTILFDNNRATSSTNVLDLLAVQITNHIMALTVPVEEANKLFIKKTRWLHCVDDAIHYSTRSGLCTSCLLPAFDDA